MCVYAYTSTHACCHQILALAIFLDSVSLEYPCWPSPVTWLLGNRNGVPLSFKAKCTSVFQLLQPMSPRANGGRRGKTEKERERMHHVTEQGTEQNKLCFKKKKMKMFTELTGFMEMKN